MAMPTDFWRNDQMLNIFRTKPCQRLARDGVCGWRSQCQFSHDPTWPRRQPRRYNYSPELCPNIRVVEDALGGTERIENNCTAGQRCPWAHSKEEVLFHPHIFKTTLCEEHTNNTGSKEKTRNAKKNRCHRYYCPFAHGSDELRTSPLTAEQRERCIRASEVFPSDVCCMVCTRHWVVPQAGEQKEESFQVCPPAASFGMNEPTAPLFWPQKAPQPPVGQGQHPFDVLSTVPNLAPKEIAPAKAGKELYAPKPAPATFEGSIFLSNETPSSLFANPLSSLHLSSESPAFIDFTTNGCAVGQRQSTKSSPPAGEAKVTPSQRDLLGEFYYAML